jgi:hypothetical protein
LPRTLASGVRKELLDHDHATVFDHSKHQRDEDRRNDRELDDRSASPLFSA